MSIRRGTTSFGCGRLCRAANIVAASEACEGDAYRDSSNRLLGGWRAYDAEAAPPHSDPQPRTRKTVLDSWVWLGATEGG